MTEAGFAVAFCAWPRNGEYGIILVMKRKDLEAEIRRVVMSSVEMDGLTEEDLSSDVPLFGEGIGLDSIDALEIGAALRTKYRVRFKANTDENRRHFRTIASLASFIAANAGIELED